jgi:uncharacterized protein (TIGR00251 family)
MILEVKVKPGAGKDRILKVDPSGMLEVALKAKAEKNQANESLCRFMEKTFNLARGSVKILRGKTQRKKTLKLEISEEEFLKKLEELAQGL